VNGGVRRTDPADADLLEIAGYLAARSSIRVAERFIDRLGEVFERLAQFPGIGTRREGLAPGLRSFPEGNYVVFYRETDEGIEIVRVLHGALDIERIFHP